MRRRQGAWCGVVIGLAIAAIGCADEAGFDGLSEGFSRSDCPPGTNIIVGTRGRDTLNGTEGDDCILGLQGDDTINGLGGNDIIYGGYGDDRINGGEGDDFIHGEVGGDDIQGGPGDDTLIGGHGADRLTGGPGNDTLIGGADGDALSGGPGNDVLDGQVGRDTQSGGADDDIVLGNRRDTTVGNDGSDFCAGSGCEKAAESVATCTSDSQCNGVPCTAAGVCHSTRQACIDFGCQNGGLCIVTDEVARCECPAGFQGTKCDDEIENCGDGIEQGDEECDDGNLVSEDGCSATCVVEFCGDGIVQFGLGEACDDGNMNNGDGCSSICTIDAVCSTAADCNDGSACTNDVCEGGQCVNQPVVCADDGNDCTVESCDPALGCQRVNAQDFIDCNGGTGSCFQGVCEAKSEIPPEQVFNMITQCDSPIPLDPSPFVATVTPLTPIRQGEPFVVKIRTVTTVQNPFPANPGGGGSSLVANLKAGGANFVVVGGGSGSQFLPLQNLPIRLDIPPGGSVQVDGGEQFLTNLLPGVSASEITIEPRISTTVDVLMPLNLPNQTVPCVLTADSVRIVLPVSPVGPGCTGPADCDDGDACTTDACNAGICSHAPIVCDDGDACTVDVCSAGVCVADPIVCDDGDGCTDDACVDGSCQATPKSCNDNSVCTTDACVDGTCTNTAIDCDDGNECTANDCDPVAGCRALNADDGVPCAGGTGVCMMGVCTAVDPCDGVDCDDGDACTTDACVDGTCTNTAIECDDGNECTVNMCDPGSGCVSTDADGASCQGGAGTCAGGMCSVDPCFDVDCNDGDACTTDSCDDGVCSNIAIVCNDGDACTDDACVGGVCQTTPVDCDDGSACTADSCNPASGCVNSAIECDDGDACTVNACDAATGCTSSAVDCGSATECTAPGCDAATGCFVTNLDGNSCDGGAGTCDGGVCVPNPTDPAAYRVTNFNFEAPAFILPFSGCGINQAGLVGGIVNGSVTGDSEPDGLLDLALLIVQNSDAQAGTISGTLVAGDCQAADADTCTPTLGAPAPALTFMHPGIGTDCIVSAKTIASGPDGCFFTAPEDFTLVLGSVVVPLEGSQGGGQYNGNPASGIAPAHLAGFLSEATAKATILAADLPLVGGLPISDLLRGEQCVAGGLDERVTGPSGALGFQFEIGITLDRVDNFTP